MKHVNDIEVVFSSHDPMNEVEGTALVTEEWKKDDLIYYDSADQTFKKATAATAAIQQAFIGIASAGKEQGEALGGVLTKARLKVKVTTATAGNLMGAAVALAYSAGVYSFAVAASNTVARIVSPQIVQNGYGYIEFDVKANSLMFPAHAAV